MRRPGSEDPHRRQRKFCPQAHGELNDQEDWAIGSTLRSRFDRKESDVMAVDDKKVQG